MLKVDRLHKQFDTPQGPVTVLSDVSFDLRSGDSMALTGESGSGKSTLLHLVAGLDTPDQGDVWLNDHPLSGMDESQRARQRRSAIGLIFQQFNLIPSLTVGANLAFQARLAGRHDRDWQAELAGRLGLDDLGDRYPEQLSGGQQQRVAIGRALAARPPLILADEPTGNLDEATGDAMMDLFLDLVADTGCTLLMVTHSPRLAARLNRQCRLTAGVLA